MIKEEIQKLVEQKVFEFSGIKPQMVSIEKTASVGFGEYTYNGAFTLAKQQQKPPQVIAQALADELNRVKPVEIERVEAVGGYINFFLAPDYLREQLGLIYKNRESFGQSKLGRGKTVIVEYSQPNIAKPMHIGHLRTTILGDALANIYEALGYKVIRWNYIGDWGTQFGKLIAAYKLWGSQLGGSAAKYLAAEPPSKENRITVHDLVALYVKFHGELKQHPELERRGQEEFAKLEGGDKENRKLWQWFRKESLKEFDKMYGLLGVKFDLTIGESFFEKELKPLVDDLLQCGIAETGEKGAIIINLTKHLSKLNLDSRDDRGNDRGLTSTEISMKKELPPALIRKADGASLYLTRDIANLKYRISKYKPAKILYVVGDEQSLHFEQLFAIAKTLGWSESELTHIKYGLVLGEDKKKMSTREGEAIPLEEVIGKTIDLARDIIEKKNPNLAEKEKSKIAQAVALGALKYEMLKEHRNSDIVFSWQKMLDFTGNSGPYLQYTYARLASILRKAGFGLRSNLLLRFLLRFDLNKLIEPSELAIMKHLLEFPDTVVDSARMHLTNHLAFYLYELANLVNRFYETAPILKDEDAPRRNARLVLISTTSSVLKSGFSLLGIRVLEKI